MSLCFPTLFLETTNTFSVQGPLSSYSEITSHDAQFIVREMLFFKMYLSFSGQLRSRKQSHGCHCDHSHDMIHNSSYIDLVVRLFALLFYSGLVWSIISEEQNLLLSFYIPFFFFSPSFFFFFFFLNYMDADAYIDRLKLSESKWYSFFYADGISSQHKSHQVGSVSLCNNWNYANSHKATLCHNHTYSQISFSIISPLRGRDRLFIIYVVFIIFCRHLMLPLLRQLVNRRTQGKKTKHKCILLNNEQGNKVNSQRSFSCISVDFSGEDQQALFLSLPIRSTPALL